MYQSSVSRLDVSIITIPDHCKYLSDERSIIKPIKAAPLFLVDTLEMPLKTIGRTVLNKDRCLVYNGQYVIKFITHITLSVIIDSTNGKYFKTTNQTIKL